MKGGIKVKTLKKKSTSTLTPAEDKLSKARIHLVCTAPFFGSVALGGSLHPRRACGNSVH